MRRRAPRDPLAKRFEQVTGIDISKSYLAEARSNCWKYGVTNADFRKDLDWAEAEAGTFDFVHSYITFIHIPFDRGQAIIRKLVSLLKPGGAAALHVLFRRDISPVRRAANWMRVRFLPLNWAVNAYANGRPSSLSCRPTSIRSTLFCRPWRRWASTIAIWKYRPMKGAGTAICY